MTTTSSPSRGASGARGLFADTCARHAWPAIVYLVAWLLVVLNLVNIPASHYGGGAARLYGESALVPLSCQLGYVLALVVGYVAVARCFGGLFDRVEAPFLGALPLRRRTLVLATFAAAVVPLVLVVAAVAVVLLVLGGDVAAPAVVGQCALAQLLMLACFMGLALLSVALSGRRLVAFVVFCMLNGYVAVMEYGVESLFRLMMPSVVADPMATLPTLGWASPGWELGMRILGSTMGAYERAEPVELWTPLVAYALVGVAAAALAVALLVRRDVERAGDGFVFPRVHTVASVLFSVAAGLGLTLFVVSVTLSDAVDPEATGRLSASVPVRVAVGLLLVGLCALVYLVSEHVLGHDARSVRAHPAALVATLAVSAALALVACADFAGVVRRVPDASEVASVDVIALGLTDIEDEGGIEAVCALHRDIIDTWGAKATTSDEGTAYEATVGFTYHLKDGTTLSRSYEIEMGDARQRTPGTAAHAFAGFMDSPTLGQEVLGEMEGLLSAGGGTALVSLYDGTQVLYDEPVLADQREDLLAAVRQDVEEHGAWCLLQGVPENGAEVGSVAFLAAGGGADDGPALFMELSEERTPATLAFARSMAGGAVAPAGDDPQS